MKLVQDLSAGKMDRVYLLYGTETYLMEDVLQRIIANSLSEEQHDFNYSKFDMNEMPVELAVEEAFTFPFMGGQRVVLIRDPWFLTAQKDKSDVEHNTDALLSYISQAPEETIMILFAPYEKLDERKKLVKTLKKNVRVYKAEPMSEKELREWISARTETAEVQFEQEAVDAFLTLTGANLMVMASELNKLTLYAADGGVITREIVYDLVARSLEEDIFALVEAAVNHHTSEALKIYKDLLKQKEAPLKILSLMVRQFRILYQVKELKGQGYSEKAMAGKLKLHPYVVKLAGRQSSRFQARYLLKQIDELAEIDHRIKTGQISDEMAVELYLLKPGT
ncbi:DNA polymerase III subunit delta [Salisediminibacterium beveridgei]|uniref:DNA polymerase III subunit delta n=1 Tax=Salisediminibacterium beveridgei TaxID=632773 RepID=A0A1D7QU75_9BACI|nr:DNA polymerase III subunit delta [Salisediminibacterium beveridgei]AOM82572.1 DNA polymerase III delta subunit [Salisediminibacterium beveridgei]